jgi:dipeptidyl aminopeptidase/acylaminoacyl peptidase
MTTSSDDHGAADEDSERSRHAEIAARLIDQRSAVGQPTVSPDGRRVAFVVATTSLDDNTTRSKVWLDDSPISGGEHDANPTWSPDGRFLAFTSRRGEKKGDSTLHVLPIGMPGETRTLCTMPDGLGDVSWSPDGRWIAFTSRTRDARYAAKDESWQAPRKVERLLSRLNGEGWIFDRPNHVHVVAADGTAEPRDLTPDEFQHAGTAWLADSSAVITSASRHDDWELDFASDLYAVPLDPDGDIRRLTAGDGQRAQPAVSPDGTRVAFIGFDDMRAMSQNAKVGVIPTDADEVTGDCVTWITLGLDRTFECYSGMQVPVWVDDETLLATAEDRGDQHLYRLTADGSSAPERLTAGPRTIVNCDVAGGTIATTQTTIDRPPELYVDDIRRTHVTEHTAAATLGWERFAVPTADGSDEIDAWIMRPADFDESATYPVLLNVHGGPFAQYGEYFFDEAQMQAAAGFVVVLGNPRGSSGRDQAWGWSILGPKHPVAPGQGWGTVDVDDVLSIIDGALGCYPFCDPERVGMLGGSYGGFMATWLAGKHGDRFRAFCSERAVNNLVSEEWSGDIATFFKMEHGVSHVEDEEEYIARSPVRFVDDIDKPMLIIHSEEDWRCPIGQAEELWIALKLRGKEVDFYRFPAEDHDLSRSGSPVHRMQRAEIILDWFTEKLAPR